MPQISTWLALIGVPWGAAPLAPLFPSVPTHHSLLGLDEGPAEPVHFGVEPAGVAQVVAGAVPPPQRGLDGAAVDTLPALGQVLQQLWGQEQRGEAVGAEGRGGGAQPRSRCSPAQSGPGPAAPQPRPRAGEQPALGKAISRQGRRPRRDYFFSPQNLRVSFFSFVFWVFLGFSPYLFRCARPAWGPADILLSEPEQRQRAPDTGPPEGSAPARRPLPSGSDPWEIRLGPLEGRNPLRGAHRTERGVHWPLEGSRMGSE